MSLVYGKFRWGPAVQIVALYPGIPSEELSGILKATLPIVGDIVGVQEANRVVIPFSLVCMNPSVISVEVYEIVVLSPPLNEAQPLPSAPPLADSESMQKKSPESLNERSDCPSDPSTVGQPLAKSALEDILNFISFLRNKEYLSREEYEALEYLLSMKSSLLPAAYSVAKSTKDSQYFAQVCKDIAENMMFSSGQSACSAQEDVLQCCDQLYINNQIDEEQLLYLRHLVLIRDNDIANLYDQFQADRSPENLIRGLRRAAGGATMGLSEDEEDQEEEEEEEQEEKEAESPSTQSNSTPISLQEVARTLKITPVQGLLLSYLMKEQDRKIVAAVTQYQRSGDLEALKSHLTQIAIAEDQKMREEDDEDDEEDSADDSDDNLDRAMSSRDSRTPTSSDDESDDQNHEAAVFPQSPVTTSRLDALLGSMNETNRWQGRVPPRFILAVFAAAQRNLLTVGHACGLCDLFQFHNSLVLAAWEVFTSQGDALDFIDTLRRIIRFSQNDFPDKKSEEDSSDDDTSSRSSDTLPRSMDPPKEAAKKNFDVAATERERETALEEVTSAKRDLLKHSLDLLAKQGLISSEAAVHLFRKSLEDDSETDAAIDAYASDRDITQFLKTLMEMAVTAENKLSTSASPTSASPSRSGASGSGASSTKSARELSPEDTYVSGALMTIADHLRDEKIIPDHVYTALASLIRSQNKQLKEAWGKYREQQCELTDVVDLMLRLSLGVPDDLASGAAASRQSGPQADSNSSSSLLSSGDFKNIVDIYVRAEALRPEQQQKLYQLIDAKDPSVTRLFESYESHRDVHQLLKDLQQATSAPVRASAPAPAPASSRQQESEEEEEVESKFLSIVKKMNLTGEETAALREAISSDDPLLRSALELFRSDGNEKNLMTNLTTISKRILKTSPARRGAQQQATAAAKPKQKGNQAQEVRSVSPPIHDIFPILLKEFVKHEILTAENVAALQSLHQSKDEVLMAALNLYDLDHDLGGLVDALVKILKYV